MKKLLLISLLTFSSMAFADSQAILNTALKSYQESGSKAFISTLLKNSPLANEKSMLASLESAFPTFETFYGKPKSVEVLREVNVSQKVNNVFFVLNYETGPVYGMLTRFDGPKGDVTTYIIVDAKQTNVFSNNMVYGKEK